MRTAPNGSCGSSTGPSAAPRPPRGRWTMRRRCGRRCSRCARTPRIATLSIGPPSVSWAAAARALALPRQQFLEARRQLGSLPFVFVLEEDEGLAPGLRADSVRPDGEVGRRVVRASQAKIAPRARGHEGRTRRPRFLGIGGAKGGAALPKDAVDLVVEPAFVTKLQGRATRRRQRRQERPQSVGVLLEEGRKLEQHRSQAGPKASSRLQETGRLRRGLAGQASLVGDAARRLENEDERIADLARP